MIAFTTAYWITLYKDITGLFTIDVFDKKVPRVFI